MLEHDDSFMDWETRHEKIPIGKHIIAGKYFKVEVMQNGFRLLRWHHGARWNVPHGYNQGKLSSRL